MNLVPRAEWGARSPRSRSRIDGVLGMGIHWEGPPMGTPPHEKCDDHVRGIQRFHMDTRGWGDIAYNFVVCPHGRVYEGRGWGWRSAANGTAYGNDHFHAACYLGGTDDPFTDAAKDAFVEVVVEARRRYPDGKAVRPHSSFKATACPGDTIRGWLRTAAFDSAPVPPTPPPVPPAKSQELPEMFIAYIDNGGAFLMYANGTKRLLDGSEIEGLKAILPVAKAPQLIAATPDA